MSNDVEVRWDRLTAPALRHAVTVAPLDASMRGVLVPGMSAIEGVNPGIFRWQHLKTRSAIGVLGEAWAASPEKGQRLLAAISRDVADALADQRLWDAPI